MQALWCVPLSSSAASKPNCLRLPRCTDPSCWVCKLSGTFPCLLVAASRPNRPLRLTLLLCFCSPSSTARYHVSFVDVYWVLGSLPVFLLGARGSHSSSSSFRRRVLGSLPWLFFLIPGSFPCLFSSYLTMSAHSHRFSHFGKCGQKSFCLAEIYLTLALPPLSPGSFSGICFTGECVCLLLALSASCTGLCGADGNPTIFVGMPATSAKSQCYRASRNLLPHLLLPQLRSQLLTPYVFYAWL